MSDAKTMNELSQAVLTFKGEKELLEYKLEQLIKSDAKVDAKLTLEINGNKRSSQYYWLSKEEVTSILNTRLEKAKQELTDATEAYESYIKK